LFALVAACGDEPSATTTSTSASSSAASSSSSSSSSGGGGGAGGGSALLDCGFQGWDAQLSGWTWTSDTPKAVVRTQGQQFIGSPELYFDAKANLWRMTYAAQYSAGVGVIVTAHSTDGHPGTAWAIDGAPLQPSNGFSFLDTPVVALDGAGTPHLFAFANAAQSPPGGAIVTGSGTPGAWTLDAKAPIISPGAMGSWDDAWVESPEVVWTGSEFMMWFGGANTGYRVGFGVATSKDGATWTLDPHNPVIKASSKPTDVEYFLSGGVSVIRSPDDSRWLMFYGCVSQVDFNASPVANICLASSLDGVAWTKSPSNPIIPRSFFMAITNPKVTAGPLNPAVVIDRSDPKSPHFALYYEHSAAYFGLATAPVCKGM
jgi:hypothetical protein